MLTRRLANWMLVRFFSRFICLFSSSNGKLSSVVPWSRSPEQTVISRSISSGVNLRSTWLLNWLSYFTISFAISPA